MTWPQIQVPFSGGLNESVDARHVPLGEFTELNNVRFETDGSQEKRYGFEELTPDAAMTQVQRVMKLSDRLVAVDDERMWVYNSTAASSGEDLIEGQLVPECTALRTPFTAPPQSTTGFSACSGNGLLACAYCFEDILYVEVYDESTMQLLTPPMLRMPSSNFAKTKIGFIGTQLVVLAVGVGSANIEAYYVQVANIDPTAANAGFSGPVVVATDYDDAANQVCPLGAYFDNDNEEIYLAYKDTTANGVTVAQVDANLNVINTLSRNVDPNIYDVAITYAPTADIVGVSISLALSAVPPLTSILGLITVDRASWTLAAENYSTGCSVDGVAYRTSIAVSEPSNWRAIIGVSGGDYEDTRCRWVTHGDNAVVTSTNQLSQYGVQLASHLFANNGRIYGLVGHVQPTLAAGPWVTTPSVSVLGPNGSLYLVEFGDDTSDDVYSCRWVATVAPSLLAQASVLDAGTAAGNYSVPYAFVSSDGVATTFAAVNGSTRERAYYERVQFDFEDTKRASWAELNGALYFNGARYDGAFCRAMGFAWAPTITGTATTAGGVYAAGEVYGFQVCYERTLRDGTVERSAPSNAVQVTIPGGGAATIVLTVSQCTLSSAELRSDDELIYYTGRLVAYMTTNQGRIYYRVPLASEAGTAQNDTSSVQTISIAITGASLSDGSHPFIYTTGGSKPATTPPSFRHIAAEDNRLYAIGDDGRTIWFSQQYDGATTPAMTLAFTFGVEDTGDLLTATGTLDARKVFFTSDAVYLLSGQGPSASNQNSDYSNVQRLPFAVGCIDWRSIVQTDDGIWFQSRRGIEMLSRSFDLVPFQQLGAKVRRTLATNPYVTSAVYVANQSQVRFTVASTDDVATARDGKVLVFDTRFQRWSTHTYRRSQADSSTCVPVSALYHDLLGYVWAWQSASDALIKREKTSSDAAPWLDYTSGWIARDLTTAWCKSTDLQGWQKLRRIRLLSEWYTAHGIETEVYYDYQTTAEAHTYSEATVTALLANSREQIEITPGKMKSQALQFTYTDTAPATPGTGRASALNGLSFEVVALGGGARNIAQGGRT